MAVFTERQEHYVEVLPHFYILQCRRADIVLKDGVEISRKYERYIKNPGEDVSKECDEVKKIADALWTPEIIQNYQEFLEKKRNEHFLNS